jgi:lipoate-protein ligase B
MGKFYMAAPEKMRQPAGDAIWSFYATTINPDLTDFHGIIPCGISQYGVTSIAALGKRASMADVDKILRQEFAAIFV